MVVSILIIGCGNRGEIYSTYCLRHPDRAKVVGLADPREHMRRKFLKLFESTIESDKIFTDWHEIVALDKRIADCVVIALPDKLHVEAAVAFIAKGYHMLLEKPMATTLDDCLRIRLACQQTAVVNAVCHVLRYYAPCIKLKQLIDSGAIGNVMNIQHVEPVGYWHFAHSYVRGNWRNERDSAFSLLAKCSHDIDLIVYWMNKKRCKRVSSFGSLAHFKRENAPKNASTHCYNCPAEADCCYSAKKIYKTFPKKTGVVLNAEAMDVLRKQNRQANFVNKTSKTFSRKKENVGKDF